jgi:hypothetical protein
MGTGSTPGKGRESMDSSDAFLRVARGFLVTAGTFGMRAMNEIEWWC